MIDELAALDEACQMFNDAWQLADWTPMDNGLIPQILWEGRIQASPPATDAPFVRFTMTPMLAKQGSLANLNGANIWTNSGVISVQAFGPLKWADGYEVAQYLAIIAKRVYQGKSSPNGMWFRNCRTNRIGPSGGWYQFNTIIEYQYDELR